MKVGRMLLPLYLLGCCLVLPASILFADKQTGGVHLGPQRLVIVLDGVPYETIVELRKEGHFTAFHPPARMVSTFPSLTNPSMIEILGADDSPGYEDHYYDRSRNRLVGGFQDRVRGGSFIRGTFRELFDYHAPAFRGSLAYIAQPLGAMMVAQTDVAAFRNSFRSSRARLFVAYIGATDSLAHLGGEGPLKSLLCSLDRTLEELRAKSAGQLEVELLSDHGNFFSNHKFVKLNVALERAGFVVDKSLAEPRSVVLPRYGLVGSAILFTQPENRAKLAATCASTEGVDLAVYQTPGEEGRTINLVSARGGARLERNGDRYRYLEVDGDPLELKSIIETMKTANQIDREGFASADDWWAATRDHRYTDPLRRLFDGCNAHVRSLGDVLVSFKNGYLIGSPFFGAFAVMHATHGSLQRGETDGFAMSTRQELNPAVRGSDLTRLFGLKEMSSVGHYLSEHGHCRGGATMAELIATKEEKDQKDCKGCKE